MVRLMLLASRWAGLFAIGLMCQMCLQPAARAQSLPLPLVAAGTVERLAGTVRLAGGGGERIATIKAPVYEGERIVTEGSGEAVLRMVDGALIALRPNSQITLVKYTFTPDPKDAKADGTTIQLLGGALRAITGVMGRRNPVSVQVRTASATIGVRGTDFEVVVIPADSGEVRAGTYSRVIEGATFLEAADGQRISVAKGQSAYVPQDALRLAREFGVLRNVPPVFQAGSFDDALKALQEEAMRQIERELHKYMPSQLQQMLPGLGDLFRRR
jgi:hypothetical protein